MRHSNRKHMIRVKKMPRTNALAYFETASGQRNFFVALTPVANVVKLFTAVSY